MHSVIELAQGPDAFEAIHSRHGQIHRHHVRFAFGELADGVFAVAGRGHDLHVVLRERARDLAADDVRIIDDHEFEWHYATSLSGSLSETVSVSACAALSGSCTRKWQYSPRVDPILIRPPCLAM